MLQVMLQVDQQAPRLQPDCGDEKTILLYDMVTDYTRFFCFGSCQRFFLGMDFANVPEMQKCMRWFLAEVIQHRVVWQKLMEPHRDSLSEVLLQPAL